jgi:hypothetical protein
MAKFSRIILFPILLIIAGYSVSAQVNSVTFGKNRVQYKKFKWQFYQTRNFNVFFYQGGQELAKYVIADCRKGIGRYSKQQQNTVCNAGLISLSTTIL